ncbi:MAG: FtsW/RodA/SpoVE family cell cycle protein [bacterium]
MRLLNVRQKGDDMVLYGSAFALCVLGLATMGTFSWHDPFLLRQLLWMVLGSVTFFIASRVDWRFLRHPGVAAGILGALILPLVFLLVLGHAVKGAKSWLSFGGLGIEPIEFVKLALIIALAKYFSVRHIEIRKIRHILISGAYAFVVFGLLVLQPDFGGAIIIFLIWLGMVLFSGISKKHLFGLFAVGALAFSALWLFGFHSYQKQRIMTFFNPTSNIYGSGYNAHQSVVAVGSGQLLGKGIGYGTQSRLRFLPEFQTDFIFAAFAEEWGFIGVGIVFFLYGLLFWRLLESASRGASNFETLFALGVLCYLAAHFCLHVAINIQLLPVTGTTIPFMSYGGSHLLAEFLALGMVSGMRRYSRAAHPDAMNREFSGGYDQ